MNVRGGPTSVELRWRLRIQYICKRRKGGRLHWFGNAERNEANYWMKCFRYFEVEIKSRLKKKKPSPEEETLN